MANKNFNDPDQTPCPWSTGDMVPMVFPPSSIQSLPLAPACQGDDIEFLERLYKLPDPRKEIAD